MASAVHQRPTDNDRRTSALEAKVSELQAETADLKTKLSEAHSRLATIEAKHAVDIVELKVQLGQLLSDFSVLKTENRELKDDLKALRASAVPEKTPQSPRSAPPQSPRAPSGELSQWLPDSCGRNVKLSKNKHKATKVGGGDRWNASALGTAVNPTSFKVRLQLSGNVGLMVGLAPKSAFASDAQIYDGGGWYLSATNGSLASKADNGRKYFGKRIGSNSVVEVRYDRATRQISFALDGASPGVAFANVNPDGADLYPAVNFVCQGESAKFVP